MRRTLYLLCAAIVAIALTSCDKEKETIQKWEYKTLIIPGSPVSQFSENNINIPDARLDTLGAHGWELVSVYTRVHTVHPNFGNDKYVTGLQANTRTSAVFYVFKRPVTEGNIPDKDKKELVFQQ